MNYPQMLHRFSMRGLKKCSTCGCFNGNRALACRNQQCQQSKVKPKASLKSTNTSSPLAVQLHTDGESFLYSVPSREKYLNHRSFVQITDRTLSSDENGCIISRNAICYVDTCKYDSHDLNISCKHIKWALDGSVYSQVTPILFDVWSMMSSPADKTVRTRLWNSYQSALNGTPMVQMIDEHTFAVACEVNAAFPAGRLHVTVQNSNIRSAQRKMIDHGFICSCKQIRTDHPDKSSIIGSEGNTCAHICLVIAAIRSDVKLTTKFHKHLLEHSDCVLTEDQMLLTLDGNYIKLTHII